MKEIIEGIYSDQISFSNLKYSQSGFQLDMFIVANEKIWALMDIQQKSV